MTGFANKNRLNIKLGAMAKGVRPVVRNALKDGGLRIEETAFMGIKSPPKTGRIYPSKHRKGAKHQASAPGEYPAGDSGRLGQSLTTTVVRDDDAVVEVQTAANTPYAVRLEYGGASASINKYHDKERTLGRTPKKGPVRIYIAPRPYMTPAFKENKEVIKDHVTLAVAQAIRKGTIK